MSYPQKVTIVEVGPRDGLQNEPHIVPTDIKIALIDQLSKTGLSVIEATSFVAPEWIPQLSDAATVLQGIAAHPHIRYPVLVPNAAGFRRACASGAQEIALFTSVSETFAHKNIHCSIEESLQHFQTIIETAKQHNMRIRCYLSCTLGCPYEGNISLDVTNTLATRLIAMGCDEISLADTTGIATPQQAKALIDTVGANIPIDQLAVHFHDTYGQALANIYAVLEQGIHIIDTAIAGLGGCPYAPGARGNVATEDVVYLLHGLEIETGIALEALVKTSRFITQHLKHPSYSKVSQAYPDAPLHE